MGWVEAVREQEGRELFPEQEEAAGGRWVEGYVTGPASREGRELEPDRCPRGHAATPIPA